MQNKKLTLQLLSLLQVNVIDSGITTKIEDSTLCLYRPVYDKPTGATFGMASGVGLFQRDLCFRRVYCVEQYDSDNNLVKFSVTLTDQQKNHLAVWDLDISHGLHTHPICDGKIQSKHVPFIGDLTEMVKEITDSIKPGLCSGI